MMATEGTKEQDKGKMAGEPASIPVVRRQCRAQLSTDERLAKGTAIANTLREIATVTEQKGELAKDFSARMKRLEERAEGLRRDIEDGCEERWIDCAEEQDFARNMFLVRRLDTGAIVDERAMEAHERQAEIDFPDGEPEDKSTNGEKAKKRGRRKKSAGGHGG